MDPDSFLKLLPQSFHNEIEKFMPGEEEKTCTAVIRTNVKDADDIKKWKDDFSGLSNFSFCLLRVHSYYVCNSLKRKRSLFRETNTPEVMTFMNCINDSTEFLCARNFRFNFYKLDCRRSLSCHRQTSDGS